MKRLVAVLAGLAWLLAAPVQAKDTVYYYYTDALHSAVTETDAHGNVIERTHYAPYGQVLNRGLRDGPGYTGHEEDPATDLVYMQQRYYDPESGRFLSTDPVQADGKGGSFNRYAYANDNPYRYADPDGRCGGPTCDTMVQNYGAWANANPEAADKLGSTVGVAGATAMLAATGAPEVAGTAGAIGAAVRYIAGTVIRQAAKGGFSGAGGVKGAEKEFGRDSGKEIDTGKQGVRVKLRSNGERVEMHDSTGKNPKVPKGTRTIKVQDKNGKVIKTVRYPDPKQHNGTIFDEPNVPDT